MQLQIEIIKNHEKPFVIEGIGKASGKAYRLVKQKAYAHLGGAFPVEIELMHDDEINAYPVGTYNVDMRSFDVDANKNLKFARNMVLIPHDLKAVSNG